MKPPAFSRKARWAVPAGVVAVVGTVVASSAIGVAQAAPKLPSRTPADLLAAAISTHLPPFSGTATDTVSLGIPQLPGADNPSSITSMLAGSHTLNVWYGGPSRQRLSVPVPMGETDVIHNGRTVWVWQASTDSVTRAQAPPGTGSPQTPAPAKMPANPKQMVEAALAAVGQTTSMTVGSTTVVAGQDAYQLVVTPRASGSSIARITIALDATHPSVPLQVQVFAKGMQSPAISVGFSSISFAAPAASEFAFTPPRGAHVHTVTPGMPPAALACPAMSNLVPAALPRGVPTPAAAAMPPMGPNGMPVPVPAGAPKLTPARIRAIQRAIRSGHAVSIVHASTTGSPPALKAALKAGKPLSAAMPRAVGAPRNMPTMPAFSCPAPAPFGLTEGAPRVIGSGWTAVAVLPSRALAGLGSMSSITGAAGQSVRSVAGGAAGPGVSAGGALSALLASGHSVHGSWGSGKLIHTGLISVLMMNSGHVLVGAVTSSALLADASQVK